MYYYGLYLCCHHNAEANGKCLYFRFFEFLSKIFIHRGHHLTSLGSWGLAFSFSWGYGFCFSKAAFSFTSAVFMFEFLVAGKSSIPTSQLERETVFKVAFFLLNVKRKLYLSAKWEVESRLQKGLCHCCCREHFVKSLQMQGAVLVIVDTPQVPHTHRHGDNVLLFPGHPLMLATSKFS